MNPDPVAPVIENPARLGPDGIWRIEEEARPVSYPAEGNLLLRAVEDASWWFGHRTAVILAALRRFPPEGPVWDLGGGNGLVAKALQDMGYPCVLVEAGADGCRNALARGVKSVLRADLDALRFRPGALPAAGLFDVIEHLAEPGPLLRRLAEALRPDSGRLFLTVPAHRRLWSREDEWAGHFARYGRRSLAGLLDAAGLRVLFLTFYFSWLSPLVFLGRTVPGWFTRRGSPRPERAHRRRRGAAGWVVDHRLAAERRRIGRGRIRHGASLLAVCGRR